MNFNMVSFMEDNYLTEGPLSSDRILSFIEKMKESKDGGGHSIFLGQVREDNNEGKTVKAIEYSAYKGMVNKEAGRIIADVMAEFSDIKNVSILHSTGIVKTGEISLLIIVSAGHRHQAINGCAKAVELVKERLPVWKREIYDDNSHTWKENT